MAQEYQPRRFFRNAPNRLLRRYFAARNVLSEVDFGALTETQVEPIYQAWLKLPDDARKEAPYMHPRLHAVAGAGGVPIPPEDGEQSLPMLARKVALAFRILAQSTEPKPIEDGGDGGN